MPPSDLTSRHQADGAVLGAEMSWSGADKVGFGRALQRLMTGLVRNPGSTAGAVSRYAAGMTKAGLDVTRRSTAGQPGAEPAIGARDRRFNDPAWNHNPFYGGVRDAYSLFERLVDELVEASGLTGIDRAKAIFACRAVADALAPTNTLLGNPAAMRRAFDTGGASVVRGMRNFLDDVANNGGRPRQVDTSPFAVGRNLAATPGRVVFRNELIELLQYEPKTERTFDVPLLLSPPWINKYYIMDLAPGRSFAEWAVDHGHTTFVISYRNPTEAMRDVTLDDYLVQGPQTAMDVIADITGQAQVNLVGLCLGGTLTVMLLAHLAASGHDRVRSATLLNTLVDFGEPGALGIFTDPDTVVRLETSMAKRGYLESNQMASTFDLLRANDLIWSYVGTNWLMGEQPPAFDILAWNSDSTRMPAAMHSFYLRSCYMENKLARSDLELAGQRLRLDALHGEVYVLAAKDDHVAPWTSQYRTTQLLENTRFVLSSAGHIAGIVNPPSSKARYWTNEQQPEQPAAWLAGAHEHLASWWEDWAAWIGERAGQERDPPPIGSDQFPVLGPAPGTYVHEGHRPAS